VADLVAAFGSGAMTNSIPELEDAKCILITGSNTMEAHPLIARRIMRAKEKGAKVIVVDPRRIPIVHFADMHLRPRPGTDVAWINGFMNVIISRGLQDRDFINQRTENYEELKKVVEQYTPEKVEQITGIPEAKLEEAATVYAKSECSAIVYAMGITQHTTGVDNVKSCANLAMLTGNVGKPSTGVNPLRGQNNVQGACDLGALPNVYPGYQKVALPEMEEKFKKVWGNTAGTKVGLTIPDMLAAAQKGELKAMYIMGENPMLSDPDINHVKKSFESLDFLVVQDIFLSETAELADVVLPGASYAEKDGTFTSTDRRVRRIRKAIEPIGESRADWRIICELAKLMGSKVFDFNSPAEIMDEIAQLTPIYGGISYDRLEELKDGLCWPCPSKEHPGTPYLHKDKFSKGRGSFSPLEFAEAKELPDEEYPLLLTTGRNMFHWHTGTMTRRTAKLDKELKTGYMEINPIDAQKMGIKDGEMVQVKSRRGEIDISARINEVVPEKVVFIPFHFRECAANILTNPVYDPQAKIPEYKVCAVNIEKKGGSQ